jgi:pimeloyl-ACP methyl ester carboxylesterase
VEKPPLVLFCHANGFCKDVWKPVAEELSAFAISPFRWIAMDFSGHGNSRPIRSGGTRDWRFAAEDISEVIEEHGGGAPVLGVGHSMGGAGLLLASLMGRESTLFRSLVLFEPVILPTNSDEALLSPLVESATRRVRAWPSVEEAHEYISGRAVFSRFDPRAAAAYARGGTRPAASGGDGVELACDPADEAALYRDGPRDLLHRIRGVGVPCHVVAGELSSPPLDAAHYRAVVQSARPPTPAAGPGPSEHTAGSGSGGGAAWSFEEMPGCGHFLVMEQPRAAAAALAAAAGRMGFGHCFRVRGGVECGP